MEVQIKKRLTCARSPIVGALAVLLSIESSIASAQTGKTFIDYIQPTPISCPLSSETWGASGVLPRDTCNGIESAKGAKIAPDYYYWDGKIIAAKDGTFHLFMSTWPGSAGFNPGWTGSESYHAVSSGGLLGPYQRKGYVFDNGGSHKGHNTSACELPDGSYALVVSEVVPFTIYRSASLDGPWSACPNPTGELIKQNGVNAGSDSHWDSNVSLTARVDGRFEIVQRHGLIAIADTLCGPYLMQKPTWAYPQANRPSIDSIYPHRTSQPNPAIINPTYAWEEDPVIWYSGGRYHVLYQSSTDRIGYELSSPDGIHDWKDGGLAYDPRMYEKIFGYVGSATHNQWYKMERPSVVLQNGHVSHVTFAVADVDKDNSIPAGSNHGSKIIVIPFDGVAFDADNGGSSGGVGGFGGGASGGGTGATGGTNAIAGSGGAGSFAGAPANAGSTSSSGASPGGAASASGGSEHGGATGAAGALASAGGAAAGREPAEGGRNALHGAGEPQHADNGNGSRGCACMLGNATSENFAHGAVAFALSLLVAARKRGRVVRCSIRR